MPLSTSCLRCLLVLESFSKRMFGVLSFVFCSALFANSSFAQSATAKLAKCEIRLPGLVKRSSLSLRSVVGSSLGSGQQPVVRVNQKRIKIRSGRTSVRLKKGLNKVEVVLSSSCRAKRSVLSAPKYFSRPYPNQASVAELKYTRLFPAVGSTDRASAASLSERMSEDEAVLDLRLTLGLAFFAQIVDHDLTGNNQFQNGPSSNAAAPVNLRTPDFDLDSVYGPGPSTDSVNFTANNLFFTVSADERDVPRADTGIALINDKRDDITGVTLQVHLLFRLLHNRTLLRFLNGLRPSELTRRQRRWIFEMARNEVIGLYQGIVVNEFAPALLGRPLETDFEALANVPVEFAAAVYRIGHSLVPQTVVVDFQGSVLSPLATSLRGPNRIIIPWELLAGESAQKSGRFDNRIAPVMQTIFIPLSPTNPDLLPFAGGTAVNIGDGRVVDGVLRLDLIETNILRGREQGLPSGEQILAEISGKEFDPALGDTDLFVYVLDEAAVGGQYGAVGSFVFERTFAGLLRGDKFSLLSKKYSKRDRMRFARATLASVSEIVYTTSK